MLGRQLILALGAIALSAFLGIQQGNAQCSRVGKATVP